MAEVKVLVKGYSSAESEEERTCCTITLIRDKGITMVVDPGTAKDQRLISDALKKEGISVDKITHVCITHSHMDHYRNIGMFPKAKAVDYWGVWDGDYVEDIKPKLSDDIRILKTPGHNYDGITLLVKTSKGIVAICGDVFWKENYPRNDPYATDKKKLEESRKKVLQSAEWIIPGHDTIYKVRR